jgi:bacillithiol biosynthesis deacetylase BshB1
MKLDVLAFAAHPDDLEITCGGTLRKLVEEGRLVGACDLTRGEMGTYGTAATREKELRSAARILGLAARVNAGLPDSGLFNTREQQSPVVEILREWRPELVIVPALEQRHPDHSTCPRLVFDACYFAGLAKFAAQGKPHRPRKILYVHTGYTRTPPSFVVDISKQMARKLKAVAAYRSQFPAKGPGLARRDEMFRWIRDRGRSYGQLVDVEYGEAFIQRETMRVDDVMKVPGDSI